MAKNFMSSVYTYMAGALSVTGIIAWYIGTDPNLISYLISETGGFSMLGWVVLLAPLLLVFAMGGMFQKLSSQSLLGLFALYSALMGASLSFIFVVYEMGSIASTFFITAGTFGVMSVLGYTTQTDLTKMGSMLRMALIGIIIAMLVNFFMQSAAFSYLISILGVLIFTGLTAYDTQKLKRIGMGVEYGSEEASKLAMMGALTLYLDFVNLFLFMLRLFGDRR
ncbi:MAG: Bax inhibitor-1/YccA family protein [Cryomorphaceae bacterium]|nr:MAG: Bax inhibitor-1/YccA family protein [Cryomorphaceae bacterium]